MNSDQIHEILAAAGTTPQTRKAASDLFDAITRVLKDYYFDHIKDILADEDRLLPGFHGN